MYASNQINAIRLVLYSMVRYGIMEFTYTLIYLETLEIKEITEKRGYTYKITHISAADFPSVAHLVSY